jgi:hypothetical protein
LEGAIIVGGAGFMPIWRDKRENRWLIIGLALKPRF